MWVDDNKRRLSPFISRRKFMSDLSKLGLGLGIAPYVLEAFYQKNLFAGEDNLHEVDLKYYKRLDEKKVQCFICPLNCVLSDGETCFCRTRKNHNGRLYSHAYNNPCVIRIDPVEKTPLNHFLPGTQTLSIATGGCNLRCLYCQNWQQSQEKPDELRNFNLPGEQAVKGAGDKNCRTIAYTYTEPVAFYEYMRDVAIFSMGKGVRNVMASAGYINPGPLRELCKCMNGFAIALKGFDEKYFEKVCGSHLEPVLEALKVIKEERKWLEITTLIVPTYNDDMTKLRKMCQWIKTNLGSDVPLHFARFVPEYKLKNLPPTPVQTLEEARNIGYEEGLRYVYLSNVAPHEGNNTYCPNCRKDVIKRMGFKVLENNIEDGRCRFCKRSIPGVWV